MKRTLIFIMLLTVTLVAGCKSVDLEAMPESANKSEIPTTDAEKVAAKTLPVEHITETITETKIIYIDNPIVLPPFEKAPEQLIGKDAATGAVNNFIDPLLVSGSASIRPYRENEVYRVFVQVDQLTDIYLELGESMIGEPARSDPVRFITAASISEEKGQVRQHVYVKPTEAGLTSTLIINTNRRSYHLVLYSYKNLYTPIVRWTYEESILLGLGGTKDSFTDSDYTSNVTSIDLRFLNDDYKMHIPLSEPYWVPEKIYDDGQKTYILLPEIVLQREFPAAFENKNDIVNYRKSDSLIIIDKLIEKITLKLDNKTVTIWKKK